MSTSPSSPASTYTLPVAAFQYPQTIQSEQTPVESEAAKEPEVVLTERDLSARLSAERSAGYAEAEARLRCESEQRDRALALRITERLAKFEDTQKQYFTRVETEVVQLALAIAGKILHREAQVDPMLLAAIVRLALGQLKEGSIASIRVRPEHVQKWRSYLAAEQLDLSVRVVECADLEHGDCILETELGTVNVSLETQLKEIETGFFDVLAQKPRI